MAHISLLRLTRKNHSKRTHNNEVQSQHRCSRNRLRNRQPSNGGRCSCTRRQRALCSSRQARRFQRRPTGCMYVFLLKFTLDNVPNETHSVRKWNYDFLLALSRKSLQRQLQPCPSIHRRHQGRWKLPCQLVHRIQPGWQRYREAQHRHNWNMCFHLRSHLEELWGLLRLDGGAPANYLPVSCFGSVVPKIALSRGKLIHDHIVKYLHR